jgi:hypothetical protein
MARLASLAVLVPVLACHRAKPSLVVPHTTGPIKIDGEWDEPDWSKTSLRGQFIGDDGALSRPTSEIRLLHDDHDVFVGLYAADDDIRSTDAFDVALGSVKLHVTATGTLDPAIPGARVAVDRDGSLDDDRNFDEEWLIELAIPRDALPTGPLAISASRCDTPKHRTQRCTAWHGTATLSAP